MRMKTKTYKCDIWLEFKHKPGHMMIDQLFSIDAAREDVKVALAEQALPYYTKHADASEVSISAYGLIKTEII